MEREIDNTKISEKNTPLMGATEKQILSSNNVQKI